MIQTIVATMQEWIDSYDTKFADLEVLRKTQAASLLETEEKGKSNRANTRALVKAKNTLLENLPTEVVVETPGQ